MLNAFTEVLREGAPVALLVAGEFVSSDLARNLQRLLEAAGICRVGYTPESAFLRYAHAVDACINLRYPSAGESSGIAVRIIRC